jgi:FMN phosphatase YigB (HAD superfamily)
MSRHYVLDFDGTLFDTDVLWEWVVARFVKEGFESRNVREVGQQLFFEEYTVGRHATALELSEDRIGIISNEFDQVTQTTSPSLVYQDVFPFLEALPIDSKSILTFGHPAFQCEKIQASKIDQHVGEIRIASPVYRKTKHLEELLSKQLLPIVFVDDNPHELAAVHEAGLPVELIRMRREGARNSVIDHELDDQAWRVIRSLDELE